jgi:hypothetical protein
MRAIALADQCEVKANTRKVLHLMFESVMFGVKLSVGAWMMLND